MQVQSRVVSRCKSQSALTPRRSYQYHVQFIHKVLKIRRFQFGLRNTSKVREACP